MNMLCVVLGLIIAFSILCWTIEITLLSISWCVTQTIRALFFKAFNVNLFRLQKTLCLSAFGSNQFDGNQIMHLGITKKLSQEKFISIRSKSFWPSSSNSFSGNSKIIYQGLSLIQEFKPHSNTKHSKLIYKNAIGFISNSLHCPNYFLN